MQRASAVSLSSSWRWFCRVARRGRTTTRATAAIREKARARADIAGALPAIEAFYADNGTYAGVTVSGLRATYDPSVPDVRIVVMDADKYCVESDVEGFLYSQPGAGKAVRPGPCPEPGRGAPQAGLPPSTS